MRGFNQAFGKIFGLFIFLMVPFAALAQTATPKLDDALIQDLKRSNTECKQEIAELRKEIRDSEEAKAEAEKYLAYLAKRYGTVPADAAAIFDEIVLTSQQSIKTNKRSLEAAEQADCFG